jgi:hypothetical protein
MSKAGLAVIDDELLRRRGQARGVRRLVNLTSKGRI